MNKKIIDFAKGYLKKIKGLSIILAIFFIVSIFFGYVLAHNYPDKTKEIIYNSLKDMIDPAKNYSSFQLFGFIFLKNVTVAVTSILLAIFFGIVPVLIIILNGLTLGVISYIAMEQFNVLILLAGILPHGIIEIPAIIFSVASGIWLWRSFYRYVRYDENIIKGEIASIIKFFILMIIPMLALAALIETFITPHVLNSAILFF